ncbi:hypothetical protein CY34DRAFT_90182, partial [Suillus luteus UH-Slu-Lm8-n1]
SVAISPNASIVVNGSADGRLRLWDIKKGSVVGDPWEGHGDAVRCLDWSPNAREVASGSDDGTIRRWNPDTGRQIVPSIEARHGRVYALKYSPQGDKFASGGEDKVICVWSKEGELLMEIKGHDAGVTSLCWSKDGAHVFSASSDSTIRKWQSIDGKELVVFRGHTNVIFPSAFPLMKAILSVHQWTAQFASGTSRPTSRLETRSCTTTKPGPLSFPLMENLSSAVPWMER